MTRAFLTLYGATGDREWLAHAREAVGFVTKNFRDPKGVGFLTARPAVTAVRRIPNAMKT